MKNNIYLRPVLAVVCCMLVLFALAPTATFNANADTGPKWFVDITFKNLPDGECYATLLSKSKSTGPHSANHSPYESDNASYSQSDKEIDKKFSSYEDKDGYYYLHYFKKVDDKTPFRWGYYPPHDFKILIYSKTQDKFIENDEILGRYAFSTYYTTDLSTGKTVKSYNYFSEILGLVIRILLTIGIEIGVALLFKYRGAKLTLIIITNVVTQLILNIGLNITNFYSGPLAMTLMYIGWEAIVFIVEAVVYSVGIRIIENNAGETHRKWFIHILYALAANLMSFILGGLLIKLFF